MTPRDLRSHKQALKILDKVPVFKPLKKGSLPAPFNRYKSKRVQSTSMLDVGENYSVVFMWRDGPTLTDRSFYGYLFLKLPTGSLSPVFEFHWHPSHKGLHCKVPCRTSQDFTDRTLPGAPELAITTSHKLDPNSDTDRQRLISAFCIACGIKLPTMDAKSLFLFDKA